MVTVNAIIVYSMDRGELISCSSLALLTILSNTSYRSMDISFGWISCRVLILIMLK